MYIVSIANLMDQIALTLLDDINYNLAILLREFKELLHWHTVYMKAILMLLLIIIRNYFGNIK